MREGTRSGGWARAWRAVPTLLSAGLAALILAALTLGVMPAFGRHPLAEAPPLAPFRALFAEPGLARSAVTALTVGLTATALALSLTLLILAAGWGRPWFRRIERLLSPILALPHAAVALSLAFLLAPSGWVARLLSPWLTGWARPPDLLLVNDPWGGALILGLVLKEVPFLLLMALAALPRAAPGVSLGVAASLGYGRLAGFFHGVAPPLYRMIRLPVLAVLVYSVSVVDMALILGPTTPPSLPVRLLQWSRDAEPARQMMAAAGVLLQIGLVLGALALWLGAERGVGALRRRLAVAGLRWPRDGLARTAIATLSLGMATALALGFASLALWSVAGSWAFPEPWPSDWTRRPWQRAAPGLWDRGLATLTVALLSTTLALALALLWLETEGRRKLSALIYLPLLVPEIALVFGLSALTLRLNLAPGLLPVVAAHTLFVFPYVFLSLAGPHRAWDRRLGQVAASLGKLGPVVFLRVRLPMLLQPILTAVAVGLAVSSAQYLATVLPGGGRVETLTTEAVALASGGDRRAIGVSALVQAAFPVMGFAVALMLPAVLWRNRRGMRGVR